MNLRISDKFFSNVLNKQNKRENKIKGISLFSGVGISNVYLKDIGIEIIVANELLEKRAKFYQHLYPKSKMIIGDIRNEKIFNKILTFTKQEKAKLLLITPPCQGFSLAEKIRMKNKFLMIKVIF